MRFRTARWKSWFIKVPIVRASPVHRDRDVERIHLHGISGAAKRLALELHSGHHDSAPGCGSFPQAEGRLCRWIVIEGRQQDGCPDNGGSRLGVDAAPAVVETSLHRLWLLAFVSELGCLPLHRRRFR